MNKIEKSTPHLLGFPSEILNNIFGNLSHRRVFFIFPQVSKVCFDLVKAYLPQFDAEETIWQNLCSETKHTSWDGKKFKPIEKGPFLSWKKVFFASEPSCYIYKRQKYDKRISTCKKNIKATNQISLRNLFLFIKNYIWENTEHETETFIAKCRNEIQQIHQKEKKLFRLENSEKTVVAAIGKQRFNQIPLFEDCLINKNLTLADNIDNIISQYLEDPTFPTIVRGETETGLKFLLLHPQIINKKTNTSAGEHYIYIHTEENNLVGCDITYYPDGTETSTPTHKGIPDYILEKLQDLVSTGIHENSKNYFMRKFVFKLNFL